MNRRDVSPAVNIAEVPLSPALLDVFYQRYSDSNVDDLNTIGHVALPHLTGESAEYVRINKDGGPQAFYIPGFTEGITAKASFGLAMAEPVNDLPTYDITIMDQNRIGIQTNGTGRFGRPKKDAAYTQALNFLEVIEKEKREDGEPISVIAHSWGSLVTQAMIRIAKARGSNVFDNANIVLLAPSGADKRDNLFKLGYRFMTELIQENSSSKDIHDVDGSMMKAGQKRVLANIRRSWREVRELAKVRLDPSELFASGIGSLAVVGYGEDKLFASEQLDDTAREIVEGGGTYFTPVSFDKQPRDKDIARANRKAKVISFAQRLTHRSLVDVKEGQSLQSTLLARKSSVRGATHNDEQFNPERAANAVRQYLLEVA